MIYTLDRIEDDKYAVLLPQDNEGDEVIVHVKTLPDEIKEGDVLEINWNNDNSIKQVTVLHDETQKRKKQATNLLNKLKNKRQKG
ncbi:DUF3006 domain-containing protein [Tenuibacillus multivorans]|uniref:DUF3006 domain-containing protein n=1 Tax=Tenuibacillus multivorans TaxID=237069 RepID=A0A1G9X7A5_9BACI|nr:DUF3006 domain-containing protein [Tenuibacillus multivorans]GEL78666.1 hypothetical protein TMU01_29010 [Tenuibacillus multivorans]SDM92630.1 Protein of unknown function [Tenuibacillus multivorans]